MTNLADTGGQEIDDPLVRNCHHALAVDLDDPVTNTDAAPLGDTTAQKAAYLKKTRKSWLGNVRLFKLSK